MLLTALLMRSDETRRSLYVYVLPLERTAVLLRCCTALVTISISTLSTTGTASMENHLKIAQVRICTKKARTLSILEADYDYNVGLNGACRHPNCGEGET